MQQWSAAALWSSCPALWRRARLESCVLCVASSHPLVLPRARPAKGCVAKAVSYALHCRGGKERVAFTCYGTLPTAPPYRWGRPPYRRRGRGLGPERSGVAGAGAASRGCGAHACRFCPSSAACCTQPCSRFPCYPLAPRRPKPGPTRQAYIPTSSRPPPPPPPSRGLGLPTRRPLLRPDGAAACPTAAWC